MIGKNLDTATSGINRNYIYREKKSLKCACGSLDRDSLKPCIKKLMSKCAVREFKE